MQIFLEVSLTICKFQQSFLGAIELISLYMYYCISGRLLVDLYTYHDACHHTYDRKVLANYHMMDPRTQHPKTVR